MPVNRWLPVILAVVINYYSKAQKSDSLYYSIVNVIQSVTSNQTGNSSGSKTNNLEVSQGKSNSRSAREDKFLVPTILNEIYTFTDHKLISSFNPSKEVKAPSKKYLYLTIAINVFNQNIEYQFQLDSAGQKIKSSSFFINPDNPEYQNIMSTEIQQLFDNHGGNNKPPKAKIRIDGEVGRKALYRSNRDTIHIDGSSSEDDMTPKKYLIYKWEVTKGNDSITPALLPDFKFENSKQKLVISEPGVYSFSLSVSDGVTWSQKEYVKISVSVIGKPVLELFKKHFDRNSQKNIFSGREKNIFKIKDNVEYIVSNYIGKRNISFKYLYSQNSVKRFSIDNKFKKNDPETNKIPGLEMKLPELIDTIGSFEFALSKKLPPGKHKYLINADYDGVKSNLDTVTVFYREKSIVNAFTGYDVVQVHEGSDYFDGFNIGALKLGVNIFVTQRLYLTAAIRQAVSVQDLSVSKGRDIAVNAAMGQVNYDFFPFKLNKMHDRPIPFYLTAYLGYYQIVLAEKSDPMLIRQIGVGIKPRAQLFPNKSKMGVLYLEIDLGAYAEPAANNRFVSSNIGVNLIYGLWNY